MILKSRASYVVSAVFTLLIVSTAIAQTANQDSDATVLLHQRFSCSETMPDGLESELEEVFITKNQGCLRGLKLRSKRLFKKEIPVWDDEIIARTAHRVNQKLKQKGYLLSQVEIEVDSSHSIGHIAVYSIELGPRWSIGEIVWTSLDSGLPMDEIKNSTTISEGDFLDIDLLEFERSRVAEHFQHMGFATFNEGFIHFEIDTGRVDQVADLELSIRGQKTEGVDGFIKHRKVKIGSIYYDQSGMSVPISEHILSYLVMLEEGGNYDPFLFESTHRRLSSVSAISSVQLAKDYPRELNMKYDEADVTVTLKSSSRFNLAFELDMTRADTRFGPLSKFTLKNRNLRGKGDVLTLISTASIASTQLFSESDISLIPNTGEIGVQCSYRSIGMPLFNLSNLPKSTYPHYELIFNAAKEIRPEYSRSFANFLFRVDWTENPERNSKIILDPLTLSYVNINAEQSFSDWLTESGDPLLQYRFSDYALAGSRVTWTQKAKHSFTTSAEWSGLASSLILPLIGASTSETGAVLMGDVPLIKYLRFDGSWSMGGVLDESKSWATRVRAGSAWIGKGTDALPYDRAFFSGGANGVRGWPVRGVGGDPTLIGVGDLRLDASIEFRNKVNDYLIMALFSDLGNVWIHESENKFRDVAMSAGVGFRFDFEFFLLRFDAAARLYDPTQNQGERWLVQGPFRGGVHFGLGHPF